MKIETLYDWIKNLILVVIFAGFIQLILPTDTFTKYVRVVMGFFIIITLLNPLLAFLQLDLQEEIPWPQGESSSYQEIVRRGEDLRLKGEEEILQHIQRERERDVKDILLEEGYSVSSLTIHMNRRRDVEEIRILLHKPSLMEEERREEEEGIVQLIQRLYQLPSSRIDIEWISY